MLYENLSAAHHPTSSLIPTNHQRILKNAVSQNGVFPVQHMAIYYHLVAELELDVFKLKLPIRSMHRRNQQADVSGENG